MSSAMNDIMHELLTKLRVISKIREGQKLDASNGLTVYTDGWINFFLRKWNRDNKDEGVRVLRDLYKALQQSVETIINESKHSPSDSKKSMAIYVLINAASELKSSIRGLDNMCKTYAGYPTTIASLDGVLHDYVLVTYSSLLEAIPHNKLTPELRESITYCGKIVYKGTDGLHIPNVSTNLINQSNSADTADSADATQLP